MKKIVFTISAIIMLLSSEQPIYGQDTLGYEVSPFQVSIIPPFSSNGPDNANMINNLSLNLFIGVSGGVDGVELGGFINVDRFYVSGFQAAGFGNTVGGDVDGLQVSGFYNAVGGDARYLQGAGFINVTGGAQFGLQGAGFANVIGSDLFGFQGAGFGNFVHGKVTGIQGSGFINVAADTVKGLQGAGFMNVAGGYDKGIQASGFGNVSGKGKVNMQAAGFMNVAEEVDGMQAAGFMNIAGYVDGVQLAGFINVCDSIDGVPIAFINIVKKNGYRRFQISASETQYVSLSYKLGVERFYGIYSFGKPAGPDSRWLYGFGFGTQFPLKGKSFMNVEYLYSQEFYMGDERSSRFFHQQRFNSHNQLSATIGMPLGNFAEAFVGPTFNVAAAHTYSLLDSSIPWEPIGPDWAFFDRTYNSGWETNVA
ncbi:MAG TPA: hypothetical protein VJ951_06805, partial [Bacteroidales bacterium]|nr:hypothetical protein [Bacteroidales bacterium]